MTIKALEKRLDKLEVRMDKLGNILAIIKSDLSKIKIDPITLACPLCHEIKPLTGSYSHVFGVDSCCIDCSDKIQYPHLFKNGARLSMMEVI